MLVFGFLLLSGALVSAERRMVNNYVVDIENDVLMRVEPTKESSGHLDLSNLNLLAIDARCFEVVSGLKNLSLAGNHFFRKLPYLVFRFLVDLEHLSLENSKVTDLDWVFRGLSNLRSLDLRNNRIRALSKGCFYGLSNTTDILLSDNGTNAIEPDHFLKPFPLLKLCKTEGIVRWLETFNLSKDDDKIKANCSWVYRPLFNRTVDLTLEDIEGFEQGWWHVKGRSVDILNLARNNIRNLSRDLINDLPRDLREVDLSWNRIRSVDQDVIENRNLRKLELRGNPIVKIEPYAFEDTMITELGMSLEFIDTLPHSLRSLTLHGKMGSVKYECTNKKMNP